MTYFKSLYRRYTPYIKETIGINFDNQVITGVPVVATIPFRGDMVTDITLKLVLPALYTIISAIYCWPVYPAQMTSVMPIYIVSGSTALLAVQLAPYSSFYSTTNLPLWITRYYDVVPAFDGTLGQFYVTTTTTAAIYFRDAASASFWGFDTRSPDSLFVDATLGSLYGFVVRNNTRYGQLNASQSGWIQGNQPIIASGSYYYYDSPAERIIQNASLYIGGQLVSSVNGNYIDVYNDQNVPYENQSGLTFLTGKSDSSTVYSPRTYYTKIPFGLDSIPLCALKRNDVKLSVTFNPVDTLTLPAYNAGFLDFTNGWRAVDMRVITGVSNFTTYTGSPKIYKNYLFVDDSYTNTRAMYTENTSFSNNWTVYSSKAFAPSPSRIVGDTLWYMSGQYIAYQPMTNYITNVNSPTVSTYGLLSQYGGFYSVDWLVNDARYIYVCVDTHMLVMPTSGLWVKGLGWQYRGSPYDNPGFPYATIITNKLIYDQTYYVYGRTAATLSTTEKNEICTFIQTWGDGNPQSPTVTFQTATTDGANVQIVVRVTFASALTGDDSQNGAANIFNVASEAHIVIRYDTTAPLNSQSSYSWYRPFSSIFPTYSMYSWIGIQWGSTLGAYDGRYIFNGISQGASAVVCVDTQTFPSAVAFTSFIPYKMIYQQVVYDGTWVYTTPNFFDHTSYRYRMGTTPTQLQLAAYWEAYDSLYGPSPLPWPRMTQWTQAQIDGTGKNDINPTPQAFDGRYMYFVTAPVYASPIMLRYDTTKPFTSNTSYDWFSKHWGSRLSMYGDLTGLSKLISVDSAGNIYVVSAFTTSTYNIMNPDGTIFATLNSPTAHYIVKYNSSGYGVWVVQIQYNWYSTIGVRSIKISPAGNVYVCGIFDPFTQFVVINADGTTGQAGYYLRYGSCTSGEGYLMKFNSSGIWQWAMNTYGQGNVGGYSLSSNGINDLVLDSTETNLYAVGTSYGPYGQNQTGPIIGFAKFGAGTYYTEKQINGVYGAAVQYSGVGDAFAFSMTTSGNFNWVARISGYLTSELGTGVATDASNNPYFSGYTSATSLVAEDGAGLNPKTLTGYAGGTWITGYTQAGVPSWIAGIGGANIPRGMLFNGTNLLIYGQYSSSITAGTVTRGTGGGATIFLASCTTAGAVNNGVVTVTGNYEQAYSAASLDSAGNVYLTGTWKSQTLTFTDFYGTQKTVAANDSGAGTYNEIFVIKVLSGTTYGWGIKTQGALDNTPQGIAVSSTGDFYLYGWFSSSPLTIYNANGTSGVVITPQSTQLNEGGGDAFSFIAKYNNIGTLTRSSYSSFGFDELFDSSQGIIPGISIPLHSGGWQCYVSQRYIYLVNNNNVGPYGAPSILRIDPYIQTLTTTFDSSLIVTYAHLSAPEVNWFRNSLVTFPFEYIQSTTLSLSTGTTVIPLLFKNPIKEFIITGQLQSNQNTYTYSNFDNLALTLNGEDLFNNSGTFFNTIIPAETGLLMPTRNLYVYRFESPVNLSRIAEKLLKVTQSVGTLNFNMYAKTVNIMAVQNGTCSIIFS